MLFLAAFNSAVFDALAVAIAADAEPNVNALPIRYAADSTTATTISTVLPTQDATSDAHAPPQSVAKSPPHCLRHVRSAPMQ